MAGMPSKTVRLSINEKGAVSVTLASPNLLESAARAIGAAATVQVYHTVHEYYRELMSSSAFLIS